MSEKTVNLAIGELIVTTDPVIIATTLGSCVSVCLFADQERGGGIIHYSLPKLPASGANEPLRYGDFAIKALIDQVVEMTGIPSSGLKAKIIGGADNLASDHPSQKVGRENVAIAKEILTKHRISIIGEDTGGFKGRKILFHIATGRLQSAIIDGGHYSAPTEKVVNFGTKPNLTEKKIKVLIVDDSKAIRDLLTKILSQDPRIEIVGHAVDPLKAELLLPTTKPDVITLDVHMPHMTGVQWLKTLLPKYQIPVVMITSLELKEGNEVFEALELGAVDYIQKPSLQELSIVSPIIREKVISAAGAKVRMKDPRKLIIQSAKAGSFDPNLIIAIGASTGGTEALREVLIRMPKNIPPIIIVQHIPPIFSRAFADRLNSLCPFEVKEAETGDAIHSNRVLIAPGGTQMKMIKRPSGYFVEVNDDEPMNRHKPSVDYLFHSVAELIGANAIGGILTGMGADGAKGLLHMKQRGARTFSQNEASCVVYGMPRAAWELGASEHQVPLEEVADKIVELSKVKKRKSA